MSIKTLPDYRLKQKILYVDRTDPQILGSYGDAFFTGGSLADALEFYQKADFTAGLQKIKNAALESGDVMLFQQAAKALHLELQPADWETIGRQAMELKKYFFARHALEKTNNEELLGSLQQIMQAEEHKRIS